MLIAGPTAGGKSALAVDVARALDGIVVNADAMQVYGVLRALTARPSPREMAGIPHRLFGEVGPERRFSTGEWLRAANAIIRESDGRPLVFVGGTGLYFDALTQGLAAVPEVPDEVVRDVEAEIVGLSRADRERWIAERDPETAARLQAADPQRVARAIAVLRATGRPLARYQDDAPSAPPLERFDLLRIVLDPGRDIVRSRVAQRFEQMLGEGAVEEVQELMATGLDPGLPAMKAIGVREIADWLAGRLTRDEATVRAVTATRQYAKRQRTWFRSRMADWLWIDAPAAIDLTSLRNDS